MPIFVFDCPEGHETEFLKLSKTEKEPKFCEHTTTRKQKRTGKYETFTCGLPLTKTIGGTSWSYVKGKNINWPLE